MVAKAAPRPPIRYIIMLIWLLTCPLLALKPTPRLRLNSPVISASLPTQQLLLPELLRVQTPPKLLVNMVPGASRPKKGIIESLRCNSLPQQVHQVCVGLCHLDCRACVGLGSGGVVHGAEDVAVSDVRGRSQKG